MKFSKVYIPLIVVYQLFSMTIIGQPGTFTPVPGSPFAAGTSPSSVAYSPVVSGNLFAAVANLNSNSVSVYTANTSTGSFTQVAGSPFTTGVNPDGVAFSPVVSGNLFAAVVNSSDNTVSVYSVNQTTGVFTQVPGSPFATGGGPSAVAFSIVSGNLFAAVTNFEDNTVSVYSVNQATGVFTQVPGSPFATGISPSAVAFSPVVSGNLFAAVTNSLASSVSVYSVNQTTGAFTPVTGSPFAAGFDPSGVAYSPVVAGNLFASVSNFGDSNVSVYSVNQTTGAFTPIAGSPFATGTSPAGVAYSPVVFGDLFVAVANLSTSNVSAYVVNQTTGALTPVTGSPFATGPEPDAIAFSPFVAGNLFAAVANSNGNSVSVYLITTPTPPPTPIQPPSSIQACAIKNIFLVQTDLINCIRWTAPTIGPTPVSYKIYRDAALTELIATIPATGLLQFCDHNRQPGVTYSYFIVSIDALGNVSTPISITITS